MAIVTPATVSVCALMHRVGGRRRSSRRVSCDVEHVIAPCGHVQVQAARVELAWTTFETIRSHDIGKLHRAVTTIMRRQTYVALALVRCVVDGDEPAVASRARPQPRDEAV